MIFDSKDLPNQDPAPRNSALQSTSLRALSSQMMTTPSPQTLIAPRADSRHRGVRVLLLALAALMLWAAASSAQRNRAPKARFEAVVERVAYAPGETARIAARVEVDDGWHLQSTQPAQDYLIPTELSVRPDPEPETPWPPIRVSFPPDKVWQASFEAEPLLVYEGEFDIVAEVPLPHDLPLGPVDLVVELAFQACDDRVCVAPTSSEQTLELTLAETSGAIDESVADAFATPDEKPAPASRTSLPLILGFGVIGGLILNAMPCVLPILSLKVVGMVKAASGGRAEVTRAALATAAGIFVSFMALAGLAIGAKSAGQIVGWGIQFQNPGFVTFLLIVLVLFCLNLWGLFEIPLPSFAAQLGSARPSGGLAGHFSSGLFATLMATPCSAPFLGSAVGFALSQSALTIALVFAAIAFGMSIPYLLLALTPSAVSWLPKPGVWMDHMKGFLGFLLAGTAVWLFYVLAAQVSPERLAGIQVGLLAVSLFSWMKFKTTATLAGRLATAGLLLSGAITLLWSFDSGGGPVAQREIAAKIAWTSFDAQEAMRLADEGTMVFVDVTADWCATCKVNERLVLETDETEALFEEHQVIAMKADWTNRDDGIAQYLADFGRYAIPFYVLYRPGQEPHVFGELLTRGGLREVVESAAAAPIATADLAR